MSLTKLCLLLLVAPCTAFAPAKQQQQRHTELFADLSALPANISPFVASDATAVQRELRSIATGAFRNACASEEESSLWEFEFPPLLGGKSQFDDFDNVQELDANRDWCVEWIAGGGTGTMNPSWLILPDVKECELATESWPGQKYKQAMKFTCIESVTEHYGGGSGKSSDEEAYSKPWGATIANMVNGLFSGGDDDDEDNPRARSRGLLGDKSCLDDLTTNPAALHVVCQPGNGGPVEDWINVAALHERSRGLEKPPTTLVVNGALDKVRDGYYAPVFFPKLAETMPFYKSATTVLYLKPVSDKGVYGWLYRVYPESWQVVLQQVVNKGGRSEVIDHVALVSETRPSYQECVQALLKKSNSLQVSQ